MNNRFKNWKRPIIKEGKLTKWNWVVQNLGGLDLGEDTDIGAFTYINALGGVRIENGVQIGSHCSIYSVSTIDGKLGRVVLEQGCCLGTHSSVMPGVTIGRNSIVGAHSLVIHDIPADSIAFGAPAKVVRKR